MEVEPLRHEIAPGDRLSSNRLYSPFKAYRSAPQLVSRPIDAVQRLSRPALHAPRALPDPCQTLCSTPYRTQFGIHFGTWVLFPPIGIYTCTYSHS